ncbi:MAG: sensor histidine kinase [Erysipelotrichaceae bacterium]
MYFFTFSLTILALLGFLLLSMIKPYYRDSQLKTIDAISHTIETRLIDSKADEKAVEEMSRLVIDSNACMLIYNEQGRLIYQKNSIGEICQFQDKLNILSDEIVISKQPDKIIQILKNQDLDLETVSEATGNAMMLYGKKISVNLANYYMLINVPLEPIESIISFIFRSYLILTLFVLAISFFVSLILSLRFTRPIIKMKEEANSLANGNYNVSFKTDSYTEINDLAATLDDATDKLSKIDELRKDLVANVSHDIKTPLTVIKSYAEMIEDISGDNPKKRNEHLHVIIKETEYLNKLVMDMQEYSKMQAGVIELNKENFDLSENIDEVIDLLSKLIEEREIKLIRNYESVIVYGDSMKISQVIYNFVSNAIKHSDKGTIIEINVFTDEEKVRLEVKDNGEGIPEEALPYIWDRYYKIDKNFARSETSTGLGLAIAKAILEAHGYKYGVNSKLDEGSLFYFEIKREIEIGE